MFIHRIAIVLSLILFSSAGTAATKPTNLSPLDIVLTATSVTVCFKATGAVTATGSLVGGAGDTHLTVPSDTANGSTISIAWYDCESKAPYSSITLTSDTDEGQNAIIAGVNDSAYHLYCGGFNKNNSCQSLLGEMTSSNHQLTIDYSN